MLKDMGIPGRSGLFGWCTWTIGPELFEMEMEMGTRLGVDHALDPHSCLNLYLSTYLIMDTVIKFELLFQK